MKTLKEIQNECVFVNAGNRCLNCGGCRQEYDMQFKNLVKCSDLKKHPATKMRNVPRVYTEYYEVE